MFRCLYNPILVFTKLICLSIYLLMDVQKGSFLFTYILNHMFNNGINVIERKSFPCNCLYANLCVSKWLMEHSDDTLLWGNDQWRIWPLKSIMISNVTACHIFVCILRKIFLFGACVVLSKVRKDSTYKQKSQHFFLYLISILIYSNFKTMSLLERIIYKSHTLE